MSTENDSTPATPADPAEMTQESPAALVQADEPAPAEAASSSAPTFAATEASAAQAGEGADSVPAAEGADRDEAAQLAQVTQVDQDADGAALPLEATAPGPEEAAAAAPAKTELSPAQCAARLAQLFPALFGTQGPPKPIKLRIQADIQQRAPGLFTRKALSIVLHRHTTTTPYLKALLAVPSRFDLDGQPAGEIAEEHRQAAREEVERRRAIVAARRTAEGQARHPREPRGARPPHNRAASGTLSEGNTAVTDLTGAPEPGAPGTQQAEGTGPQARPRRDRGHREGAGSPDGRPPRGPQPFRERQASREPHAQQVPRDRREPRPPRPDGHTADRPGRQGPGQGGAPQRDGRPSNQNTRQGTRFEARHDAARPRQQPEAQEHTALPEDPARRERALLLRTYEASSLTKANFCVLKRITEAELDDQLALARQERGPARPRP